MNILQVHFYPDNSTDPDDHEDNFLCASPEAVVRLVKDRFRSFQIDDDVIPPEELTFEMIESGKLQVEYCVDPSDDEESDYWYDGKIELYNSLVYE